MSSSQQGVECLLDYAAQTGESPTWSVRERALYWIDIQQCALHRFDPSSGQDQHWMLPDEIGCFALHADGRSALVALRSGLYRLQLVDGWLEQVLPAPFDPRLFRCNEGACDRSGRFWFGTMYDPKPARAGSAALKGAWYSFSEREGLREHPDFAVIPNGLGWDADDRTMYVAHSREGRIYAFEFELKSGTLGRRRTFATIDPQIGVPDGCAIDAEGGYWSALHGGARLRRFSPDGRVERDIHLPVRYPTMCAFGGAQLDELYVTSAAAPLNAQQRAHEPLAGKLLRLRPGVRGRAPAEFAPAPAAAPWSR